MTSELAPLRLKIETLPILAATRKDNCLGITSAIAWPDGTIDVMVRKPIADLYAELSPDQIHDVVTIVRSRG